MRGKKYKLLWALLVGGVFVAWAFAVNTIISYVSDQSSTWKWSYNHPTRIIGDDNVSFNNKDNDSNIIGDYFSWKYYDPMFGFFDLNKSSSSQVRVASTDSDCSTTHNWYLLEGYSYNEDFWFVDFSGVKLCTPKDSDTDNTQTNTYLTGFAYSENIGYQNFSGIILDSSVDQWGGHASEWRYVKIEWVASSKKFSSVDTEFANEVRVIGDVNKASIKKGIEKNVFQYLKWVSPDNGSFPYEVSGLSSTTWGTGDGKRLQWDSVLYFGDMGNANVELSGTTSLAGIKTVVVTWGNIYIKGDIRGNGMLWLIAISKDNKGGNIYIDPAVTDIHANMYASKSVLSYKDGTWELEGDIDDSELANQLYILGSIFSENTIWGNETNECPFFVTNCSNANAKKYDLNYLRRYILVQPLDADNNPVGDKVPQFGGAESYMWDNSNINTETQRPGDRKYPFIIEYNSKIQTTPPPFFD